MNKINIFALGATGILLAATPAQASCTLGDGVKRIIQIQFDNVHLRRDNPNVPSDLELMPNLLNFLQNNGVVSGNHYTPLISHTAGDILATLTGLYHDRLGMPVSNSYRVFDAAGHPSAGQPSFVYWTATNALDGGKPVLINENGKTAPAPWVPFTRAGCDVGAFSIADLEFETLPSDVTTVFGAGSPQDVAVRAQLASSSAATRQLASTNWLGVAIHCAQGSALCQSGGADNLPDEAGGYTGFKALYGDINARPAISPSGPIKDLDGNVIADSFGQPGFPNGFNPTATQSLGYIATMLEAGVPVVFGYIADAHDNRSGAGTFGPGEAAHVAQLKQYDAAWGKFFARLAADGITPDNSIFIITADENDHFVGGAPSPGNCDGVNVACTYPQTANPALGLTNRSVGELTTNLDSLLDSERGNATPFFVHSDDAPPLYIDGNPQPTDAVTRKLELDLAALVWNNPLPGKNDHLDTLAPYLADRAEMKLLHMVTSSPARTPSFVMFGNPDYFFQTTGGFVSGGVLQPNAPKSDCATVPTHCVFQNDGKNPPGPAGFAWNHGDVQKEITRTWFGMAGPGVKRLGRYDGVFSDHTDLRPTLLTLVGLVDDYVQDGRVLVELLQSGALPYSVASDDGEQEGGAGFVALARVYKQLNAPLGSVGRNSLLAATRAIKGEDAGYARYLGKIDEITTERDQVASEIKSALNAAAFSHKPISQGYAERLIRRARQLIERVGDLAER
ncbi:hypothetical protein [Methylocystis bryophila]|uniref:Phosphoesterase n=1 Tax=Methylocystis bryophila TaxID=655015 RepID=A0A1W6MRM7_9HYPH|nr:hypothetical protein [Methylocystis bryophila]ARN80261.1 hypothetical protein B1812_03245 [Methylocystis bryophila]BDV40225.1 hypothetical protein DSM21852_34780 [Methylocystis bryophila]